CELQPEGGSRYLTVAFLQDGKRVRGCTTTGGVRTFSLATSKPTEDRAMDVEGMGTITAAAFDPAGRRLLLGDEAGHLRIHALEGREGVTVPGTGSRVEAVAWSPDGTQVAVGCRDGSVRLFLANGTPL